MPIRACNDSTRIYGTIPSLDCPDAFAATVMFSHRGDRSDNLGGHRQKLHNDKFGFLLPVAYIQLTKVVAVHAVIQPTESMAFLTFLSI